MKKQILNTESYSPLYKQLMQKLRADIQSGVYPVHSRIPSEQELCETYQVSRVTVRKALSELTQEGLLKRHQGKGTFVGIPRIQKDLRNVHSFHDDCRMMGCTPGTRVLHVQWTHPEEADRVAPVSYTHLDVYKRQGSPPGRTAAVSPAADGRRRSPCAPCPAGG